MSEYTDIWDDYGIILLLLEMFLDTLLSCISLTFTALWVKSADNNLTIFFLFFPENRLWPFLQIISAGDSLREMSKPVFREK